MFASRRLLEEADPLSKVAFPLPADALSHLQPAGASPGAGKGAGRAPPPPPGPGDSVLAATGLDALHTPSGGLRSWLLHWSHNC